MTVNEHTAENLAVAYLKDAARKLTGKSAAGPLGLALIQLRRAADAVSAELAGEARAARKLAGYEAYQVALAMVASGMPETVDGQSVWSMSADELARLAVTDYQDGAVALLALMSDREGMVES